MDLETLVVLTRSFTRLFSQDENVLIYDRDGGLNGKRRELFHRAKQTFKTCPGPGVKVDVKLRPAFFAYPPLAVEFPLPDIFRQLELDAHTAGALRRMPDRYSRRRRRNPPGHDL